jgi:carbonic anhydrase
MKNSITSSGSPSCRKVHPAINHLGVNNCLVPGHFEAGMVGEVVVNK